ncbi:MAG: rod shape-determining protein RodA [Candidatus Doudnabacteria bacterium]|nr:rod shape-determining protein RodA [Candidatus Doudnabacteria bacterium]
MIKHLKYFDWPLFAAAVLLALAGLLMIYSTGLESVSESNLWLKQLLAFVIGIVGLFFFSSIDYRLLRRGSSVFYLLAAVLLIVVLIFGLEIRGARRWLDFSFINFQPAEFSKLALLILLAKYCQLRKPLLLKFRHVLLSFMYVAVPVILIMWQPDLGSAIVHLSIWLGILLLSNMPRRYFLYLLVIFLLAATLSWSFLLQDYQKDRLRSFVDPASDPLGRSYNLIQSIVAVGSGGLFGRGLARGLQSQLRFLPERQTDFIFASTVEELGILGGGFILALLLFLLYRIMRIVNRARDSFGTYVSGGIFFLIFTQTIINIGMNLGLLPVTGITLPFLSYGGSSLVITFWSIGILENVAKNAVPVRFG